MSHIEKKTQMKTHAAERYLRSKAETPPLPFMDVMYAFCAETNRSSLWTDGALRVDRKAKGPGDGALPPDAATRTRAIPRAVAARTAIRILE